MIKTNELRNFLKDGEWRNFFDLHKPELKKFLSRKDGAAVSSDIGISFDPIDFMVTTQHISFIHSEVLEKKITLEEIYFLFNLIALSSFGYDNELIEDLVIFLSSPEAFRSFEEVLEILKTFDD